MSTKEFLESCRATSLLAELEDDEELPDDSVDRNNKDRTIMRPIVVDSLEEMLAIARNLSPDQMVVFGEMIDYAIRILIFKTTNTLIVITPPRLIVIGK